ncbi:MAG: GntR family transcriptional regulator [Sphaerochaetaceae bacterium]
MNTKQVMDNMESYGFDDLNTKAYKKICSMIRRGELKPGQKLVQEDLAGELGISRTPLLQALNRLSSNHYVENIPRRGAFVRVYSDEEIVSLFEIRSMLEPMATSGCTSFSPTDFSTLDGMLADQKTSVEDPDAFDDTDFSFHMFLLEHSSETIVYEMLRAFSVLFVTERLLCEPEKSLADHEAIVEALKEKDFQGAGERMSFHIKCGSKNQLMRALEEKRNG